MYKNHKTFVTPEVKLIDLILDNYTFLLLLENFKIDFSVGENTIKDICIKYSLDIDAFLIIANLYNGFFPDKKHNLSIESIKTIIFFLKNSHKFYLHDKYPELKNYIEILRANSNSDEIKLIETFFNDYFKEVREHLDYEDTVAFPYFHSLIDSKSLTINNDFTVKNYITHHTDIETKIEDLKSLFLKHLKINAQLSTKRKFLNSLFGLEFDLKIHSIIEEEILIPLIKELETKQNG